MFIDASALCAILFDEPEREDFELSILSTAAPMTSAIAAWETARAVVREQGVTPEQARRDVDAYLAAAGIAFMPVGEEHYRVALDAFDRFGKGRHPAALNMGDCFAYACARTHDLPMLFKGDDFQQTDIASALDR